MAVFLDARIYFFNFNYFHQENSNNSDVLNYTKEKGPNWSMRTKVKPKVELNFDFSIISPIENIRIIRINLSKHLLKVMWDEKSNTYIFFFLLLEGSQPF